MSITGILNIGRTLLTASQTQLGVTSHNIANANSPGYSRQEVILEVSTPINHGPRIRGPWGIGRQNQKAIR